MSKIRHNNEKSGILTHNQHLTTIQRHKLTGFVMSISSFRVASCLLPASWSNAPAAPGFANSVSSSDARWTRPSRNAYSASKNDFVIFETKPAVMRFCLTGFDDDAEE